MALKPKCKKCQKFHWSFDTCEQAVNINRKTKPFQPPVEWGKSMEGSRIWGDWTHDYELLGGQNLVLKKED